MEKLQLHRFLFPLLVYFSSHLLLSSAYTLPHEYFINCGSSSNTTVNGRIFVGDVNSGSSFSVGRSSPVKDDNLSTAAYPLYQTARIFKQESFYEFQTTVSGTYLIRFHFYPFSSLINLADALFDVSASGFSLLSNFRVANSSNSHVMKEFAVPVQVENFRIDFTPQESSFGFVNAIEVFPAPNGFFPDRVIGANPAGHSGTYKGVLSQVLYTIHRINVGGLTITPDNDTLWRSWILDDAYLYFSDAAKNSEFYSDKLKYQVGGATTYSAPDHVYRTAKELNTIDSISSNFFNVTCNFIVNKNSLYFVRVHFCDIISRSPNALVFNFYIYSKYGEEINPYNITGRAAPFYYDYIVDSHDSGYVNISIGPREEPKTRTAFLNGLEIMELIEGSGLVLVSISKPKKKFRFVIVGSVVGGVAFAFILMGVILWSLKRRKSKPVKTVDWIGPLHGGRSVSRTTNRTANTSSVSSLNLGLKIPLINNSLPMEEINLAEWAMSWQKKGQLEKIVDPFLVGKINSNSLRKFGETAEKCLKDCGADRPTMRDLLWDLKYALELQHATTLEEGYMNSTTDASSEMPLLGVQCLPSSSFPLMEKDDAARENDDGSDPTASDVFSQLRITGAR